tara:strand:+ start:1085 stop:1684 length:600 start_codon:yes stop_codon:yes gene_type:complete
METNRAYIPNIKQYGTHKCYDSKIAQSQSRDKHNKQRAANHRLNKKKIELISLFEKKPLFAFTLLEESIIIIDTDIKNKMNRLLTKYETKIRSITNCFNDRDLDNVVKILNTVCDNIDNLINKTNFIEMAEKGFFKTKSGKNLLDDEDYIEFIDKIRLNEEKTNQLCKSHNLNRELHKLNHCYIQKHTTFADMLKTNLK